MKLKLGSFYSKLSLLFLVLILSLGAGSIAIAFSAAGHLFDEVEQLLNREYAASIAEELQPLADYGLSSDSVKEAIHYMMVLNPMVEIYLVNNTGEIMAYFTHPEEKIIRNKIDLQPLEKFADSGGTEPVSGDDPRTVSQKKPFSAAPLRIDGGQGYVYVILRGQSYDRSVMMLKNNYYIKTGLSTFLFAVLATLIAGFTLFFLLTARLRKLSSGVIAFEKGSYDYRVDINGEDEIGSLGKAFNKMAESIEQGVEKLKNNEKQRKELIANISHDLRSPLTAIRGRLETVIIRDLDLTQDEGREFLRIIYRNVTSFQSLVEELFELAGLENNQILPDKEYFQFAELAQDVILKLQPTAQKEGIRFELVRDEELPPVNGDIAMLERVLTNLLNNAAIHSPADTSVRITLRSGSEGLKISVSDSGEGIPGKNLNRVFERFYRGDSSRSGKTAGTGLGLAITREIINLHGGSVSAANLPEGGAEFTVIIPF